MLLVVPGQTIFMFAIYLLQQSAENVEITLMFAVVYLTAAVLQVGES